MPEINENAQNSIIEHLNRVLVLDDVMTFQKLLLTYARGRGELTRIAEQVGVRRETIWRYETGAVTAPFEVLVKIISLIGAKLVIIPDEGS